MLKTLQIDYVRQVFENVFEKNAIKIRDNGLFTDNDIKLFSFYEHLTDQDEVNRYVETYNELVNQQNKNHWVGFGILTTSGNPTMTNIKGTLISPFEWTCTIRCSLENRDKMVETIYDLIDQLKGRKQEVAELQSGKLLCVGTLGNRGYSTIRNYIVNGDFIGRIESGETIADLLDRLEDEGFYVPLATISGSLFVYCEQVISGVVHLKKYNRVGNSWLIDDEFDETNYRKMKLDLSLDEIRIDQPYNLNVSEFCTITFGGSATLCDYKVKLGNDLLGIVVSKKLVKGETDYVFGTNKTYLEPLELPSGINANSVPNLLRSNYFKQNSHIDSVAHTLQYSFVLDESTDLLKQWFEYARYGINNLDNNGAIQDSSITPNIVYEVKEIWSSWGVIGNYTFLTKLVEDIDIEESESDALTLGITMQIQGGND